MDQAALNTLGLNQIDTALNPVAGLKTVTRCDHWPYFADFIEPGSGGSPESGPNLIENPSFETGNTSNWSVPAEASASVEEAAHGTYSLKLSHTNHVTNCRQIIALDENTDYTFTVDIKYPASGTIGALTARLNVGGAKLKATVSASTEGWLKRTIQFNSEGNTTATLDLYCDSGFSGTVYVDDLSLTADHAPLSGYDAWADEIGGGLADADDDFDGRSNLLEYALNGNPTNALDKGGNARIVWTQGALDFVYPCRNDDPHLTYQVEVSTNLVAGGWAPADVISAGTNTLAGAENYEQVTHRIAIGDASSYLRLKITAE